MSTPNTPPELSEADLSLLTDEEREAIADGADEAAEQEALARIAASAADDEGDDEGDDDDVEGAAAAAAPDSAAVAAAAAADPPATPPQDAAPAAAPAQAAAYSADLPADFEAQQQAVAQGLSELRTQFKDGSLDVDDYEDQRDTLLKQRDALSQLRTKAEISAEMREQSAQQSWQAAIDRAFDAAAKPEGGAIDYRTDTAKAGDLDLFVRTLAQNPAHADKDMDLQEGHRRVQALHGITPKPKPTPAPAPPPSRRMPVEDAPKTLAMVPGADGPGDVGGEFADVDALDGEALEAAIARMSPVQLDKYTRGR